MSQVDLNELRRHVAKVQEERDRTGDSATDRSTGVFVDPEAKIHLGSASGNRDLSRVPVEKFAAFDLAANRAVASQRMPKSTIEVRDSSLGPTGIGWAFDVETEFQDKYKIILFYDGANYQAHVLYPELEARYKEPHRYHLFNGQNEARICMGNAHGGGMPTLEQAYAKAVVWANGFSVALRGHTFPWNYDQ